MLMLNMDNPIPVLSSLLLYNIDVVRTIDTRKTATKLQTMQQDLQRYVRSISWADILGQQPEVRAHMDRRSTCACVEPTRIVAI